MDPFKVKTGDDATTGGAQPTFTISNGTNAGAAAAAASAAAAAMNAPAPANDASLEAVLSQKMPKSIMDRTPPPMPPAGPAANQHHPVAEFLYQLTKMLTDDNSEIIEWVDGRIKVHYPERLESEVLHKYFRHSKFASFQRQVCLVSWLFCACVCVCNTFHWLGTHNL